MGNSALANRFQGKLPQEPYLVTSHKENPLLPKNPRGTAPLVAETNTFDREGVREVFLGQGIDNDTADILITS